MKRNKMRGVFIIFMILIVVLVVLGFFDYNRFKEGKLPLFAVKKDVINDGGTTAYYGIGYQIVNWKIMDSEMKGEEVFTRYLVGSEFHTLYFVDPLNDEPGVTLKVEG